jgi:hypothetical protein
MPATCKGCSSLTTFAVLPKEYRPYKKWSLKGFYQAEVLIVGYICGRGYLPTAKCTW